MAVGKYVMSELRLKIPHQPHKKADPVMNYFPSDHTHTIDSLTSTNINRTYPSHFL